MRYSCRTTAASALPPIFSCFPVGVPWLYPILPQPGCLRKRRRGLRMLTGARDRLQVCSEELSSCCCCDKMAQSMLSQSWKLEIQNQRQQDCAPLTDALDRIVHCLFLDAVVPISPFSCIPPIPPLFIQSFPPPLLPVCVGGVVLPLTAYQSYLMKVHFKDSKLT